MIKIKPAKRRKSKKEMEKKLKNENEEKYYFEKSEGDNRIYFNH